MKTSQELMIAALMSVLFVGAWTALPAAAQQAPAQSVSPNMTGVPRLAIGGYDTRLAQMNDKAEWRCIYAGQPYSDGAFVCGSNGYIQLCNKGTWQQQSKKC
jgi:hypothetical protein